MNLNRRAALVAIAVVAYLVGFWPAWWVRDTVLAANGHPPYQGVWILIPHVFLYNTLQALLCFAAWGSLVRRQWIAPPRLAGRGSTVGWGIVAGLVSIAIVVAYIFATGQEGAFHAPRLNGWVMAANVFSNFYEEFIFRGFLLAVLAAALGFWPAAVLSSVAFGATHMQYPLSLQVLIAAVAVLWAWVGKRCDSLLAPYAAHMTLDWLIDPVL